MSVVIVHPIKDVDLSPALVYGELRPVNARYVYADELDGDRIPETFMVRMVQAANSFRPDKDYLLIGGDHLQLVAMASLLASRHPNFRVLRYDRKAQGYVSVTVTQ